MKGTFKVFDSDEFSQFISVNTEGAIISCVAFFQVNVEHEIYDMEKKAIGKTQGKAILPFYVDSIYIDKKGKIFRKYQAHKP